MTALLLLLLACPARAFVYAVEENAPATTTADLRMPKLERDGVFVVSTRAKAKLAGQVADALGKINAYSQQLVGASLRLHGVVLIDDPAELPAALRERTWINVDGKSCLVLATPEASLPLKDEFSAYMLFPLLAHENVDDGIKAEVLGGRLTQKSVSSRWFVEGIADYAASRAVARFQPAALGRLRDNYLGGLASIKTASLDLENADSWWPPGGTGNPIEAVYSYAAANYAVTELSKKNGDGWIKKTLARIGSEGTALETTAADFSRIASPLAGRDVSALARAVNVRDVRAFALGLARP